MLNTQKFLKVSGWMLLLLVLLGFVGLGPTANASLFGHYLYFDSAENLGHLLLAGFCLATLYVAHTDRWLRIGSGVVGVVTLVMAVIGLLNIGAPVPNAGLFNLELVDTLLHLAIALAGFWVAFMPDGPMFVREGQELKAV